MASVLVVDDSLFTRRSLKTLLIQGGHEVIAEASNGMQAFNAYKEYKPDIVTMDVTMPIVNGVDATKNIIELYPNANIIMISAVSEKNMIFDSLQLGAKHYIIKPFTYEKVISVVEEVLHSHSDIFESDSESPSYTEALEPEPVIIGHRRVSTQQPYSIENIDSKFVINILRPLEPKEYEIVKHSIKELKVIKPLKILLNFGDIKSLDDENYNCTIDLVDLINRLKGSVMLISQSPHFIDFISQRNPGVLMGLFSNTAEIAAFEL